MTARSKDQWNDMAFVRNDKQLHAYYKQYWDRLFAESWDPDGTGPRPRWGNAARVSGALDDGNRVYVFERDDTDPVANTLAGITGCRSGDKRVHLAAAFFNSGRPRVRAQLSRIQKLPNCNVQVVQHQGDHNSGERWVQASSGSTNRSNASAQHLCTLHHKFLFVDALFGPSKTPPKFVITGSHNVTGDALRKNDENALRLELDAVAEGYANRFATLSGYATNVGNKDCAS